MVDDFDWQVAPLGADDERLVDAYLSIGRSLDDLPYTADFENLFRKLGRHDSQDERHAVFKRLLSLRKMGRLPRIGMVVS